MNWKLLVIVSLANPIDVEMAEEKEISEGGDTVEVAAAVVVTVGTLVVATAVAVAEAVIVEDKEDNQDDDWVTVMAIRALAAEALAATAQDTAVPLRVARTPAEIATVQAVAMKDIVAIPTMNSVEEAEEQAVVMVGTVMVGTVGPGVPAPVAQVVGKGVQMLLYSMFPIPQSSWIGL
jgi:hypothetical protein